MTKLVNIAQKILTNYDNDLTLYMASTVFHHTHKPTMTQQVSNQQHQQTQFVMQTKTVTSEPVVRTKHNDTDVNTKKRGYKHNLKTQLLGPTLT